MSKVVTRTYEYDKAGRIVKETETVTETPEIRYYTQPIWVQPQPYRYYPQYGTTWSTSGGAISVSGSGTGYTHLTNAPKPPDEPDAGVTAKV